MATSLLSVLGALFVVFTGWKFVQRVTKAKSPIAFVAGPTKDHWFKGNYGRLFQDGLEYNLNLAQKYGGVVKIFALLGQEQLYVSDPRALHHIVVKEQDVFGETDMFIQGNRLIFGEGLIATLGPQHAKQRKMLNPVFSLANMRALLPTMQSVPDKILSIIVSQIPTGDESKEIDVLPWLSRGALDYVCQATIGHSFDALDAHNPNEFTDAVRHLAPTALQLVFIRPFVPFIVKHLSPYWRNKLIDWLPLKALKEMRRISKVMDDTSRRIFEEKKSSMSQNFDSINPGETVHDFGVKKDIMSVLLRANEHSSETERLTDSEVIGQMSTIIFAGFDNTANATARILYTLAREPQAQAKLRSEIRKAKLEHVSQDNDEGWEAVGLPYDVLMGLPYLDAILRETLRIHPPTSLLGRTTRKATTLPLAHPIKSISGSEISSIPVPENTNILISILAANHNKEVWGEDASIWRPERWLASPGELHRNKRGIDHENRAVEKDGTWNEARGANEGKGEIKYPGVYGSMMTFLGGGRACIAFKFAEMEIKQTLATMLSTLHFSLPSSVDENGNKKEIYWKMSALQVPVVRPPAGDNQTAQVPLDIRLLRKEDFA